MTYNIAAWNCNVDNKENVTVVCSVKLQLQMRTANGLRSKKVWRLQIFEIMGLVGIFRKNKMKNKFPRQKSDYCLDDSIQILQKLAWICNVYDPGRYKKWTFFILFFQDMLTNPKISQI